MSTTPKTLGQMVEEIVQAKYDQEAEWKRLAEADQQLHGLTLWTIPDLVEALTRGRVHIAPGHDPALTAPTTAQEALDLAWSLAHEVKEGQTIPTNTEYLFDHGLGYNLQVALGPRRIGNLDAGRFRTLDPLPEPSPDWLNAPAVLAEVGERPWQTIWLPRPDGHWACTESGDDRHWSDLADVTPLYPKERDAAPADIPDDPLRRRAYLFHYGRPWGTRLGGDPA